MIEIAKFGDSFTTSRRFGKYCPKWDPSQVSPKQFWVIWMLLATGVFAVPVAWLLQNLLSLGRAPLRPRTVLLVGIVFAIAGVSVAIARLCARSRPAKLITISNGKITRLGSLVSGRGWSLPVIDITTRTTDLGFVKQVRLSGRRKRTTYPRHYFRPKLNLIVSLMPCRRADMKSSQKKDGTKR